MRLKSIIIAMLILVSSSLIFTMTDDFVGGITPDDGKDGVQYLHGTWAIINFPESYTNETIILTGNLTSYNHLTLQNTALKMNSTLANKFNINFYTGTSNLTLKKNSLITANNPSHPYDLVFNTGSKAYIEDSTISYAGYAGGLSEGVLVKSNAVIFNNSIMTHNYNGIVCFSVSPKIYNSVITDSKNKDMVLKGNSHPMVVNTKLDKNKVDVLDTSSLTINWWLTIKVNNLTNAQPLEGVKVTIKNASGEHFATLYTDKKGMVDKQLLPECSIYPDKVDDHSPYTIVLEKDNFKTLTFDNVDLTKSKSVLYNMTLKPLAGSIEGNVTDDSGNPVSGVKVTVSKAGVDIGTAFTDSLGQYQIEDVPASTGYTVAASKIPKYESDSVTGVEVTPKNVTKVDLEIILRELPISSIPKDGAKNIAVNAILAVTFQDVMNSSSVESNIDIIENSSGVIVSGSWNTTDNKHFWFTPEEPLEYETEYVIRVFNFVKNITNGNPLWDDYQAKFLTEYSAPKIVQFSPSGTDVAKNANIFIAFDHSMNKSSVENSITITPAGTATFQWSSYQGNEDAIVTIIYNMLGGIKYNITISKNAFSKQNKFLVSSFSWEFSTKSDLGSLTGRIIDEDGNPIKDAKVTVQDAGVGSVNTDSNGYYTIEGIREGSYKVNITKKGFKSIEEVILISPGVNDRGPLQLIKAVSDEEEEEEELTSELVVAYSIIVILIIIILIIVVLIAVTERKEVVPPAGEERIEYIDPYSSAELGEGEREEEIPGRPPYRGRCPTCKHEVYGDYGCFHCASGGSQGF